jgi:hypothetical protein
VAITVYRLRELNLSPSVLEILCVPEIVYTTAKMQHVKIDPKKVQAPTRNGTSKDTPAHLPAAKASNTHPIKPGGENASIYFVGTATTIMSVFSLYSIVYMLSFGQRMARRQDHDGCTCSPPNTTMEFY